MNLRDLARLYGIQLSYRDSTGTIRRASREALEAVLRARMEAVDLRARTHEPVRVVWGQRPLNIEGDWEIRLEGGEVLTGRGGVTLPHGYHTLRTGEYETLIIAAPERAYAPEGKSWGIFAPVYAMRTQRSWDTGDLGDLRAYREWQPDAIVATLPMLAAGDDPSPYAPSSRLYWNEMYLEPEGLPEFDPSDVTGTRDKRRVIEKMLARFRPNADYEAFAKRALDYAEFRGDVRYHLYAQYRMSQQMREASRNLYLDFPLGVSPDGYDAHRFARAFAKGVSVGAPPDVFFTKGQNWGFRPFDPDAIRDQHHDYFRAAIAHHASHATFLRIDHVMGLHRLFWIPDGFDAKDGVYVRYRAEEMYAILTLESNRHRCAIVGEDLGTVPQSVPAAMKIHGLRRMYVVQYDPEGKPEPASVASINTHDMPTFAGFWRGLDIDDRVEQGLLDDQGAEAERAKREKIRRHLIELLTARRLLDETSSDARSVLKGLLRFLAASSAELVLVNLEDLWLETEPQNRPGVPERSFRQRFAMALEEARNDANVTSILRAVAEERRKVDGNAT